MKEISSAAVLPDFGNWIRVRIIKWFMVSAFCLFVLGALSPLWALRWLLFSLAFFALMMGIYLLYIRYQFADEGGGLQQKLWEATLKYLQWDGHGTALDVGTGNGSLAILVAKRFSASMVIGVDLWGDDWEYSRKDCERNAQISHVFERVKFEAGSATNLPFADNHFDVVVSHFVFHEASPEDGLIALSEALRVLKPGGSFSFHDMFYEKRYYGDSFQLKEKLKQLPVTRIDLIDSRNLLQIPRLLRSKKVLGSCGIVWGVK